MSIAQHYAHWLRKEADKHEENPTKAEVMRQAARTIEELWREVERLHKDESRLDWLTDPDNVSGFVQLPKACVLANPDSLRAAIDMAMDMEDEK